MFKYLTETSSDKTQIIAEGEKEPESNLSVKRKEGYCILLGRIYPDILMGIVSVMLTCTESRPSLNALLIAGVKKENIWVM